MNRISASNNVSVDCVVLGFDGEDMNVLLLRREGQENGEFFHDMKLPGGLIYDDENLDAAAQRVLHELTGLDNVAMTQFRSYGSAHRMDSPKDIHWLETVMKMKINRVVTVAYIAAVNIDEKITNLIKGTEALWVKLSDIPALAFDHNIIIGDAFEHLKTFISYDDSLLFSILPQKFTILQYRLLLEALTDRKIDNANIYKKIAALPYMIPLKEKEQGSNHRAARYYSFDAQIWKKSRKK